MPLSTVKSHACFWQLNVSVVSPSALSLLPLPSGPLELTWTLVDYTVLTPYYLKLLQTEFISNMNKKKQTNKK